MALTDDPYLPFYVDDWMNNNKLKECSHSAHGIMVSIMCIMHKSDTYGVIELKAKYKQKVSNVYNFALYLHKLTCFEVADLEIYLGELIDNKVLFFEEDKLICQRMLEDGIVSKNKALSGSKGGRKSRRNRVSKEVSKIEANAGNGIGFVSLIKEEEDTEFKEGEDKIFTFPKKPVGLNDPIVPLMIEIYLLSYSDYLQNESDFRSLRLIANGIRTHLKMPPSPDSFEHPDKIKILKFWKELVIFSSTHSFYSTLQLSSIEKNLSGLIKTYQKEKNGTPVKKLTPEEEYQKKLHKAL